MKALARLLVIAVLVVPVCAAAQIAPPAPGVEMPQAYYDRIAQDPSAFRFQRAWLQKAERAKRAREEMLAAQPGPEALTMASLPDAVRERVAVAGTVRVPAILINYSNVSAPYSATIMQNQLFDGPTTSDGTIGDLYDEMSAGLVDVQGDVHGVVNGTQTDTFYEGGCNGLCGSAKTGLLILQALQGVDGSVDFGLYDNDGPDGLPNSGDDDGFVDFIAIIHPEGGGECGGTNMWSHRWVVSGWPEFPGPYNTNDPIFGGGGNIQVLDYTIQPSKGSVTGCGTGIIEIGVYAHEFGHAFGLPDLYDTNGGGQGIGEHGLMGSGNWQNPPNPVHMSPWSKNELGWVNPQVVDGPIQNHTIDYVEANDDVYQLNVAEEKFNRKNFTPIAGAYSLHCGLPTGPADTRNWPGHAGYGNDWREEIRRDFAYNGSGTVQLEYDVSWDTEAGYDFGRVLIDVGGTVTSLVTYSGTGSQTDRQVNLSPYLSGPTDYQIIFRFTSDVAFSDEDGQYLSGSGGPFKIDNVSVAGGGESYSSDFEAHEGGWYADFAKTPNREYFLVENRNSAGFFDQHLHGQGLHIWHVEQNVTYSGGNTSGSTTTANLRPAGVQLVCADNLNNLLMGVNRGDAGDAFPGSTNNTTFNNGSAPDSKSHNGFATNVVVENISSPGTSMTADMTGGYFPPTINSITPVQAPYGTTAQITDLSGTFFVHGATVFLRRSGFPNIPATNVEWHGKALMTGDIVLNGVTTGTYDVVVKNPDGNEAVLVGGFFVEPTAAVFIDVFNAEAADAGVELTWDIVADEPLSGFRILRRELGSAADHPVHGASLIASDRRSYLDSDTEAGKRYEYALVVVLADGSELLSRRVEARARAYELALQQNYPNPFNPTTTIRFTLPARSAVALTIFNPLGQRVRELTSGERDAGVNTLVWDGRSDSGDKVASGVYLYKLHVGNTVLTRKMLLLK